MSSPWRIAAVAGVALTLATLSQPPAISVAADSAAAVRDTSRTVTPRPSTSQRDTKNERPGVLRIEIEQLSTRGRYPAAEARAKALLDSLATAHTTDSLEVAQMFNALAVAMWRNGHALDPAARRAGEQAVGIMERLRGPRDPEVAECLMSLNFVVAAGGDFDGAQRLLERALEIAESALGPDHPKVGWIVNSLGILHLNRGAYSEAKPLLERGLRIRENEFGPNNTSVAASLNPLGNLLQLMGDYPGARKIYERALAIRELKLGPDHVDVVKSLRTLASLDATIGDYTQARSRLERAIVIEEKMLGPDHRDTRRDLDELAGVLLAMGDTAATRVALDRARGGTKSDSASTSDPENLGAFLMTTGDLSGAHTSWERALATKEKAVGRESPATVPLHRRLGHLLLLQGKRSEARAHFERALAIDETALGGDHPLIAALLLDLARIDLAEGHRQDVFARAHRAEDIGRQHVRLTMATLPERQALHYAAVRASGLDLMLSQIVHDSTADNARSAWDGLIRSRGIVLDAMAVRHRRISELRRLSTELIGASERLANLQVRGLEGDMGQSSAVLEAARRERERTEQELAERSEAIKDMRSRDELGLNDVLRSVPRASALVAFARYREADPNASLETLAAFNAISIPAARASDRAFYLALVLKAGETAPHVVPLGHAAALDSLVAIWRALVDRPPVGRGMVIAERRYRDAAVPLRRALWDPVLPFIEGSRQVFLVPDGTLHLVSFASLAGRDSTYLVEEAPTLHYLATERDLVPWRDAGPRGDGLLAVGGPDFDASPGGAAMSSRTGAAEPAVETSMRGARPTCESFKTLRFASLPGTRLEAETIGAQWRSAHRVLAQDASSFRKRGFADSAVTALTGRRATKTAFAREAPGKSILHLATHGFFLTECASALDADAASPAATRSASNDNPLVLSGLALAGANQREKAPVGTDDGILTADEIARLDLGGVEWAVLSACETGVGEIRAGEGVFGLRRAFQTAGARTLVLSLWPVDDAATEAWMQSLYRARLVDGLNTAECVRLSCLDMLHARRAKGESTHPFYWAAFVASGDWH